MSLKRWWQWVALLGFGIGSDIYPPAYQSPTARPYDQIAPQVDQLPDKHAKIVLYCRSGRMSATAAECLVSLGYNNLWNWSGGMVAWEQAGLKIDR
ncbi:MAG TPA: rhodanese-like domain-containing protein [Anaerolineales bacterium]|nr:rhodanese-like domain-containing protein [Anaerolineales bacterium]